MKYIRIKSSFLFSALLSAAAKFFSPDHYQTLYDHVENQLKEIMCAGKKSAEIVQGICLMTYWKQPSDSRAWLLVGYAIRACIEMGWHQLRPTNLEPDMMVLQPERETELRERRNKERMWLLLFVYDRSVSLQVGKPWMIQMDALIRSSDTWHQHAYAVPGTDQVMSAFVQLRVLGSELLDKFCVDFQACSPEVLQKNEVILKLFNGDLDRWEGKWYRAVEEASANISHRFLIHFYGTHLRLLLNSYRLQLSILSNGSISKEALWVCYTSALDMLRLVVDRLGVGSHLFYCQDSVHAMVAYATTVVIKILLTLPRELPPDAESKVLGLINETSEAFRRQRPASNTSCFHQYLFLSNIAKQYQKSKRESMENEEEWIRRMSTARSSSDNNYDANSYTTDNTGGSSVNRMSTTMAAAAGLLNLDRRVSTISGSFPMMPPPPRLSMSRRSTQISPLSENGPGAAFYSSLSPPATASSNAGPLDQQSYPPNGYPQPGPPQGLPQQLSYPPPQSMPGMQMGTLPQQGPQLYPSSANPNEQGYPASTGYISGTMATGIGAGPNAAYPLFADNVVWEDLFANAGFSVNSGAFLPTNLTDA
ncbi:hypothetical protein KEM55_002107 [Ascosphaera atra]|nr:hypothetical protein KEM55_002107 [Ascosphaera atra]